MIPWRVSKNVLVEAQTKARAMGSLRGSILRGKGNVAGFVGKILMYTLLQKKFSDIRYIKSSNLAIKKKTIAVRVKQRTVAPQDFYNCSATVVSLKEKFDYFAFGQVSEDMSEFWLLGFISWDRFMKEGHILHKGEYDGKFVVKEDCRNIKIGDLDETI